MIFMGCVPSKSSDQPKGEDECLKETCKLTRIDSKFYSKDVHTERKFNIGLHVEKVPGGVAFKTQNELIIDEQRIFNPVNKTEEKKGEEPPPDLT